MEIIKNSLNNVHRLYYKIKPYQAYLSIILLRLTLDMVYVFVLRSVYGYSGFILHFVAYKYILSWVATLVMTPLIVKLYHNSSVSATVVLLINLVYFIPGCTLYSLLGLPDLYFLFYILYWIILMFWQYKLPYIYFRLVSERLSKRIFTFIIVIIAVGAVVLTGFYNGFQLNFRLDNIYELRAIRRSMNLPIIARYFQPFANIFVPLALIYFLVKKKYIVSFFMIIIQFLLFSFGGEKFALFMIPFAILGYMFYREKRISWFSWGLVVLNILALLEYIIWNSCYTVAYFQFRSMLLTNLISFQFFDYFSVHTPDFLMQSILRRLGFVSDYDIPITYLLGREYYGNVNIMANNGMIGDAFTNFAWLGLILFPLFIILALRFMDACAYRINRRLILPVVLGYMIAFINEAFFTVMLTSGFLFMCIALYFMPREGEIIKMEGKQT